MRASVVSRRTRVTRVERASPLIVPRRPSPGLRRHRFAGDRRLVDRALAGDNISVERDLLAGANDDQRTDRDLVDGNAAFAGRVADQRVGGRQIHQCADGVAGAVQRPRLERLGETEQEDDGCRFRPLAQHRRAGRRDDHQHVDVERPDAHRAPGFARRPDTPAANDRTNAAMAHPATPFGT